MNRRDSESKGQTLHFPNLFLYLEGDLLGCTGGGVLGSVGPSDEDYLLRTSCLRTKTKKDKDTL